MKKLILLAVISVAAASAAGAETIKVDFDGKEKFQLSELIDNLEVPAVDRQKESQPPAKGLLRLNMNLVNEWNLTTLRDVSTGMTFSIQQRDYPYDQTDDEFLHFEVTSSYLSGSYSDEILQYRMNGQPYFDMKDSGLKLHMDSSGGYAITGWFNTPNLVELPVRIKLIPVYSGMTSFMVSGEGINLKFDDKTLSGTIDEGKYSKRVVALIMGMSILARIGA